MTSASADDRRWMRRALALSRAGWGRVHPNPLVGAVVVADGRVVGEGHHAAFGEAHAEVGALERAGERARGATLYVTLEPCVHVGKTGACCPRIVQAGIGRVVYALRDPNPQAGGGADELARSGLQVTGGVMKEEAARLNAPFLWWQTRGRPFLALKLAVSLDGRIAEREGVRTDVTGPEARDEVMRLRAAHDAILIGAGTARIDDPLLTVRGDWKPRVPPLRVVLDTEASLSLDSRLVSTARQVPLLVLAGHDADPRRTEALRRNGVEVEQIDFDPRVGLRLEEALGALARRGRTAVLCEGGASLATSLLRGGHVQRLHWLVAPRLIGPQGVSAVETPVELGGDWMLASLRAVGEDAVLEWDHGSLRYEAGEE